MNEDDDDGDNDEEDNDDDDDDSKDPVRPYRVFDDTKTGTKSML